MQGELFLGKQKLSLLVKCPLAILGEKLSLLETSGVSLERSKGGDGEWDKVGQCRQLIPNVTQYPWGLLPQIFDYY